MLEKASRILGGDRVERLAHSFDQRLPTPGLRFAEDALYLAESLLYGIQVGRVGRQIE